MHPEFMRIFKTQMRKQTMQYLKWAEDLKRCTGPCPWNTLLENASLWEPSDRDPGKFDKPHRETQV